MPSNFDHIRSDLSSAQLETARALYKAQRVGDSKWLVLLLQEAKVKLHAAEDALNELERLKRSA